MKKFIIYVCGMGKKIVFNRVYSIHEQGSSSSKWNFIQLFAIKLNLKRAGKRERERKKRKLKKRRSKICLGSLREFEWRSNPTKMFLSIVIRFNLCSSGTRCLRIKVQTWKSLCICILICECKVLYMNGGSREIWLLNIFWMSDDQTNAEKKRLAHEERMCSKT